MPMLQDSISIIEEEINVELPTENVRVLAAQPFIAFKEPIQEPFPLDPSCEARLSNGLDNVIAAARQYIPQFIVFPEFSIPGVSGVERLRDAMLADTTPCSTVVIGGIASLSLDQYASLGALPSVDVRIAAPNAPTHVAENDWINASFTMVKEEDSALRMWVQPKVSPSWPESSNTHQRMFKGKAVHLFKARFADSLPCYFFSALCYDWIGREFGTTVPQALLNHFNEACSARGGPQNLNWVFLLQHNPRPNDDTFLSAARDFLTDPKFSFVNRDDAAILMVCTASSPSPGRNGAYGCSSVVFSPGAPFDMRACPSTFTASGATLRRSTALRTCKDAVFREKGECFHLFDMRNPRRVRPDATDRTLPIEQASVFSFTGVSDEPRLPGAPVPAVTKWLNDELDEVPDIASDCLAGCPLEKDVAKAQHTIVAAHRLLPSQAAAEHVHLALASSAHVDPSLDPASHVDEWNQEQHDGIEHVIHSLAIIKTVEDIDVANACIHARHPSQSVEIAVIRGNRHSDCFTAFDKCRSRTHSPMLLVSRDRHNTSPLPRELECFADPSRSDGIRVTDAQTLLTTVRNATLNELHEFTSELFNVSERRII